MNGERVLIQRTTLKRRLHWTENKKNETPFGKPTVNCKKVHQSVERETRFDGIVRVGLLGAEIKQKCLTFLHGVIPVENKTVIKRNVVGQVIRSEIPARNTPIPLVLFLIRQSLSFLICFTCVCLYRIRKIHSVTNYLLLSCFFT
mmetsp:Transcript_6384/g.7302  ORF Transcript_6384/g.7302 Transcript_6384/m.7302 type:complete len:145 (-) Transcript_6384:255-689(-)